MKKDELLTPAMQEKIKQVLMDHDKRQDDVSTKGRDETSQNELCEDVGILQPDKNSLDRG